MVMFCWFWLPPSAKETLFGITNETRPHGGLKTFFGPLKILVCVRIGPKNVSVILQLERALAGLLLVLIYLTSCLLLLYPLSIHPSSAAYPEAQTSLFQDHFIQLFQDPKALSGQPGGKELCWNSKINENKQSVYSSLGPFCLKKLLAALMGGLSIYRNLFLIPLWKLLCLRVSFSRLLNIFKCGNGRNMRALCGWFYEFIAPDVKEMSHFEAFWVECRASRAHVGPLRFCVIKKLNIPPHKDSCNRAVGNSEIMF